MSDLTAYPILVAQATITFVVTRVQTSDGTTRASGAIPMARGQLTPAMVAARKPQFTLDTGGGQVERAAFVKGLGRWDDDSYRSMYVEIELGATAIPVYVSGTPATWFAGVITFATVRTPADLAKQFHTTANGFCDASGNPPIAWLNNSAGIDQMGKTNAIIASMDANYLSHCGAVGYLATETESEALANGQGANALRHKQRFDTFMVTKHYSDATVGFRSYNIATGAPYNNSATDGGEAWRPGFPHPPSYYNLRQKLGESSPGGGQNSGFAYYDRANAHLLQYYRTGELNYYFQGLSMAWAYRWKFFWEYGNINGLGNEVGISSQSSLFNTQPEQMGMHYLLTGDPESLTAAEGLAIKYSGDTTIGAVNQYNAEPRPMAREIIHRLWGWLVTRPPNVAYPEGINAGNNGVESQTWSTLIDDTVTRVCSGTAFNNVPGGTNGVPTPGWQNYWQSSVGSLSLAVDHQGESIDAIGVNNFMQPMVDYALIKTFELYSTNGPQRTLIYNTVLANCNYLYPGEFEGWPFGNPFKPAANSLQSPCFRNEFSYNGPIQTIPQASSVDVLDILALYPTAFAWLGKRNGGVYRSIAERILNYCVGTDNVSWDGITTPSTGFQKTSAENYHNSLYAWGFVQQSAAGLAIPSDVTSSIRVTGGTSFVGSAGTVKSVTGLAQTLQRFGLSGKTYTARSNNTAVATVTIVGATGVATITMVAPGTTQIFITADGIDSLPITVNVTTPQYKQDFTSLVVDPLLSVTIISPSNGWTVSAASAALVMGGSDASFSFADSIVVKTPLISLDLAGANGAVVKVTSRTNDPRGAIQMIDNAGKGFGAQIVTAQQQVGTTVDNFSTSSINNYAWPAATSWMRFAKSGTNFTFEDSLDGVTWILRSTQPLPAGMNTSACRMVFGVKIGGVGTGMNLTIDNISIEGGLNSAGLRWRRSKHRRS